MSGSKDEPIIRLARPEFGRRAKDWIDEILSSGRLVQSRFCESFERALEEFTGASYALTLNSGTSALLACLKAVGVGPGTKVGLSDLGFAATLNTVALLGAAPVFLDVEDETLGISAESLQGHAQGIDVLLVVHQLGIPVAPEVFRIAESAGLTVLEDAACGLGSRMGGRHLGTIGSAGALSFHPRKVITTGEGGAVLTDDLEIARKAAAFRNHGFVGSDRSDVIEPGLNLRLAEIPCALGLDRLETVRFVLDRRRRLMSLYVDSLGDVKGLKPVLARDVDQWNVQTLALLFDSADTAELTIKELLSNGIEANRPLCSLSSIPHYASRFPVSSEKVRASRSIASRLVAIPCHEGLSERDVRFVCKVVRQSVGKG